MNTEASETEPDHGSQNPYLEISGLEFSYGEVKVLHGLEFQLVAESIGCVMGRNGVGKTTFLRNLVGLETPSAGKISIEGKDATKLEAYQRACNGIGYVPQGRQIFPLLTVEENLLVALEAAGITEKSIPSSVYETFPVLHQMRKRRGGDLSGGQQQQLAIGRALVTRPKFLVLDEPTEGIQPNVITMIGEVIRKLVDEHGMTILLVEQYVDFVRKFSDSFAVMNRGRFVAKGSVDELDSSTIHKHLSV
ncbi:MAG: urea ABC transporter ATP-binding subunit UrtE [Opitutae bacterium]|nr:urea ABC transporter ATP-binding subunit UrtE [Opitutae bacterium]|tara:strand:+ start:349 stop:1095 length:747 start_codon:yes stop_codon:yes gene_type:complete